MTNPRPPAQPNLPGNLIVDWGTTAARRNASQLDPRDALTNAARLGALLVASGVDPIVAGQVTSDVQDVISGAVMASVHMVAAAINTAHIQRAEILKQAMRQTPKVDIFGQRYALAEAVGDPTVHLVPDPTPA